MNDNNLNDVKHYQAGGTDLNKSIDRIKFTYYRPTQSFCLLISYENAMLKILLLMHWRIYGGGVPGARHPLRGYVFTYIFTKKHPRREILDPPL